jgi:hypothetical protein
VDRWAERLPFAPERRLPGAWAWVPGVSVALAIGLVSWLVIGELYRQVGLALVVGVPLSVGMTFGYLAPSRKFLVVVSVALLTLMALSALGLLVQFAGFV